MQTADAWALRWVSRMKVFLKRLLLLALVLCVSPAWAFRPDIRPGYGVTAQVWLSDYHPPLKGTPFDTPVYIMDSGKPGAAMLLIGGTHSREIAGYTAALLTIENARVTSGRLFVIPALNASGYGIEDLSTNIPRVLPVEGRSGKRLLPYGDRRVALEDWGKPDGKKFVHASGYEIDDPEEARNLNRNYPGVADGSPAEQVAFAVMELVRREKIVLNLDMHEADTPEFRIDAKTGEVKRGGRLAYMLISNPALKPFETAAEVVLMISEELDLPLKLEASNPEFRGLSHLEIGNATGCWSFLMETPNPGQDSWREVPDVLTDIKYPLKERAGLHLEVFMRLIDTWNAQSEQQLKLENVPGLELLKKKGFEAYLN